MSFGAVAVSVGGAVAGAAVSSALAPSGGGGGAAQGAAQADPFASQRGQYQDLLSKLISDPKSIQSSPGYQFQVDAGLDAVNKAEGASGMLNSGNRLLALQNYGQGQAKTDYYNQAQLLAQLAGANVGSPGTAGQITAANGAANQQAASAIGNQVGGAVGQGISGYLSQPGYQGGGFSTPSSTPGYSGGGNTYGFNAGVNDPSYGVNYGFSA
jgi:hypothetical protein